MGDKLVYTEGTVYNLHRAGLHAPLLGNVSNRALPQPLVADYCRSRQLIELPIMTSESSPVSLHRRSY